MRICLDTCCLMRPFDDRSQPRVRDEAAAALAVVDAVRAGEHRLVVSDAHVTENDDNPYQGRRAFAEHAFFTAERLPPRSDMVEGRAMLWQAVGLGKDDAFHLAFAEAGAVDVFATCDDNLLKRSKRMASSVRIVSLLELHRELFP